MTKQTEQWKNKLNQTSGFLYIGRNVQSKMAAIYQKLNFPFFFLEWICKCDTSVNMFIGMENPFLM